MLKFIVSCYYWPAVDGRLRLRSLRIRTNRRKPGLGPDSRFALTASADNSASSSERRQAQRLRLGCDAELTASLAILDTDAPTSSGSLVFLGLTRDLSAGGLALVLPSTLLDERYCGESARLHLSLHLPTGPVNLEVNPVRCVPLNEEDMALGYLVGAKILSLDDNRDVYDNYLRKMSDLTLEN